MQDANAIASTPRSMSNLALSNERLPGQPPQLVKPISSGLPSSFAKAPLLLRIATKSAVPGQ